MQHNWQICEETLLSDQKGVIEQTNFGYFALGKALEKQTKVIEDPGQKQIKTLEKENS